MADIFKNQPILSASTASVVGSPVQVSMTAALSVTVIVSVSAATLDADVVFTGTNDSARALDLTSTLPPLTTGTVITSPVPNPSVTYTAATGVLSFANLAIGTYEVTVAFTSWPTWFRAQYDYSTGGGSVDLRVVLGAWSV